MESRYAVLIGNSLYPQDEALSDLRCPGRDVDGLERALKSQQVGFNEVKVLKDIPHHLALKEINQVLKKAKKTDLVLIYFSGHGKLDPANRLHLCSIDTEIAALEATAIPVQSIKNFIDIAETRKVGLVLDCCFSGAVGGVFAKGGVDDQLQQMSGGRGVYVIAASTAIQAAVEKEGDEYSVFTKHFIEGLEQGGADTDSDGVVTLDELYEYVHEKVLDEGSQQPMKWTVNVEGDMVVANASGPVGQVKRKKIRTRLLELASQGVLPDKVLAEAMTHLNAPRAGARELDKLLDDLANEKLTVGEFVGEWMRRRKSTQEIQVRVMEEARDADAARRDAERREAERLHAERREQLLKEQARKDETTRQGALRHAATDEAARQEAANREAARMGALRERERRARAGGAGQRLPGERGISGWLTLQFGKRSFWLGISATAGMAVMAVVLIQPSPAAYAPFDPLAPSESPYAVDFEGGLLPATYVGDWTPMPEQTGGLWSLASATITHGQSSAFSLTPPSGVGSVSFNYLTDTEECCEGLTVLVNGVEQAPTGLISETNWSRRIFRFAPLAPLSTVTWRYTKDGSESEGADRVWVDDIVFGSAVEGFEDRVPTDFYGDWIRSSSYASGGSTWSMESRPTGDNSSSFFELEAPAGAIAVAFDYRTDVEQGFDFLFVLSDGVVQDPGGLNSAGTWLRQTVNIGMGSKGVRWEYRKDESEAAGMDKVWVDNVEFLFPNTNATP